jgi:transcriptional regulator with XRE-family HTH domain
VADATGLMSGAISLIERGLREPRRSTRRAIAGALGVPERLAFPDECGELGGTERKAAA